MAEAPKVSNKNRYLVFFDDGYAVYLHHKDIGVVYSSDQDVWKDVDKNNREFVRDYIQQQQLPKKYMITLMEGDKVRTELNGRVVEAEVNKVEGNLPCRHHVQAVHNPTRGHSFEVTFLLFNLES